MHQPFYFGSECPPDVIAAVVSMFLAEIQPDSTEEALVAVSQRFPGIDQQSAEEAVNAYK